MTCTTIFAGNSLYFCICDRAFCTVKKLNKLTKHNAFLILVVWSTSFGGEDSINAPWHTFNSPINKFNVNAFKCTKNSSFELIESFVSNVTWHGFIIQQLSQHMKDVLYRVKVRRSGRNFMQFCFNFLVCFFLGQQLQSINWNGPLWTARRTGHSFFRKVLSKSCLCHEQLPPVSEVFIHQPDLLSLLRLFGVLRLVYAILLPLAMLSCLMDFAYEQKKLRPDKARCLLSRSWDYWITDVSFA